MATVPYIPLYIGDWEQDMNCVSLQAEAAWLKIIFKMFKDDKSGIYKTSTKALQKLWKCDTKEVQNILDELKDNNVAIIDVMPENGEITFKNRRMLRQKKVSKARSEAVQNRYKTSTNTPTKPLQRPEYDNEYDNTGDKGSVRGEEESPLVLNPDQYPVHQLLQIWLKEFPKYPTDQERDFPALFDICEFIRKQKKLTADYSDGAVRMGIATHWQELVLHIAGNSHFSKYNLAQVHKYIQSIIQSHNAPKPAVKSELQFLYELYCEKGKITQKQIEEKYFTELNDKGLVPPVSDAMMLQARKVREESLPVSDVTAAGVLRQAYLAKDPDEKQRRLIEEDKPVLITYARKQLVRAFFAQQREASAKDVFQVKKAS